MPKLYILMRNDLFSLNPGKAMAQASHASSQFLFNYYNLLNKDYDLNNQYKINQEHIENWLNEGCGFGTTLVFECPKYLIEDFIKNEVEHNYINGTVLDETYPFLGQKELLDLLSYDELANLGIEVDKSVSADKYGMIKCTRPEITCYWFFVTDDELELPLSSYCIELHR